MTKRYTIADLRADIEYYNEVLIQSGSNCFFREHGRNGYQAVDLMYIGEDGREHCQYNLECGSARVCGERLIREVQSLHSKILHGTKPTRSMAKGVLSRIVNFEGDFHVTPLDSRDPMLIWAKLTKYRRPKDASGSRVRYFFQHLQKRVTL